MPRRSRKRLSLTARLDRRPVVNILARLASGHASVTELGEPFAMSQPAISKHLKVLERYRRFWEGNFQRLDALLEEPQTGPKMDPPSDRGDHR